jgi:hypothetical protein
MRSFLSGANDDHHTVLRSEKLSSFSLQGAKAVQVHGLEGNNEKTIRRLL